MSPDERKSERIGNLPANIYEALKLLATDEIIKDALGEHVYRNYLKAEWLKWEEYRSQVHPWEIEQYLATF